MTPEYNPSEIISGVLFMKAVKINMKESENSKPVKAIIIGVFICWVLIMVTTVILAGFLSVAGNLFENIAGYIMLVPLILGGYCGSFMGARINGAKGLIIGVIIGMVACVIMLILGFSAYNTNITYMTLLKLLCTILPSALGGIKGVNKKEKFKI